MNHWFFNKAGMVALATGLVIALAAGAVFAGSSEQRAEGTFEPAGGASGEFKLRLEGDRFKFEAKGEGIFGPSNISFCLNELLIDNDNPDDRGRWELDEDDPEDLDPPVMLSGEVTIREDTDCGDSNGVILVSPVVTQ